MWAMHAVAALITIVLLHRGERALVTLAGAFRRAIVLPTVALIDVMHRSFSVAEKPHAIRIGERLFAIVSHRGPPLFASAKHHHERVRNS